MNEAVYINVDETSLVYHYGGKKGLKKKRDTKYKTEDMKDKTSVHLTRKHCSLIAAICSNPNVQEALPQVLLPNVRGKKGVGQGNQRQERLPECTSDEGTGWLGNQ